MPNSFSSHHHHPPHVVRCDLQVQQGAVALIVLGRVAASLGTGESQLEKLWQIVEERVEDYWDYEVSRGVMEPGNDINKTTFIQRYIKLKKKYDEKYAWVLLFLIQKMQNYNYDTFPCFDIHLNN